MSTLSTMSTTSTPRVILLPLDLGTSRIDPVAAHGAAERKKGIMHKEIHPTTRNVSSDKSFSCLKPITIKRFAGNRTFGPGKEMFPQAPRQTRRDFAMRVSVSPRNPGNQ